jgi:nitroimidazol reductase NimA-like FMN-containing flavoprotein (pyridoxamine 5'-phosphate oxidase superfamily)
MINNPSTADYSLETIHQIVNSCPMLHVSFQPPNSPFPAVLPMIGQMGSFSRPSADVGDVLDLYLHGYVSSRMMSMTRNNTPQQPQEEEGGGLPVTICASHLDGLVLSLTPNSHSYNYRSAVLFGHASLVTDTQEKLYAMELLTDGSVAPGRWANTRVPPNAAEMQSTSVLRVKIASGSAKIRSGGPHDERGDMEDREVMDRVWTGVVPVYTVLGEPVAGGYNRVAGVPEYLEGWIRVANQNAYEYATEATVRE